MPNVNLTNFEVAVLKLLREARLAYPQPFDGLERVANENNTRLFKLRVSSRPEGVTLFISPRKDL